MDAESSTLKITTPRSLQRSFVWRRGSLGPTRSQNTTGAHPTATRSRSSCERESFPMSELKAEMKLYNIEEKPTWCAGCGDFGILASFKQALVQQNIFPHEVCLVSG